MPLATTDVSSVWKKPEDLRRQTLQLPSGTTHTKKQKQFTAAVCAMRFCAFVPAVPAGQTTTPKYSFGAKLPNWLLNT